MYVLQKERGLLPLDPYPLTTESSEFPVTNMSTNRTYKPQRVDCNRPNFADFLFVTSDTYLLVAAVLSAIIITFGILFNGFIIFALWRRKQRTDTPQFRITLNIAATDLTMCLLLQSFRITVLLFENQWVLGDGMCQFHAWLGVCLIHMSLINASMITFERYIGCCYPLRYHQLLTDKRVRFLIVFSWIIASLTGIPPLLGWGHFDYLPPISACTVTVPLEFVSGLKQKTYMIFLTVICLLHLIIIGFCYINIIWIRYKVIKRTESLQNLPGSHDSHSVDFDARKGVCRIGLVLLTLAITWIPLVAELVAYVIIFYTRSEASLMLGNALSIQCIVFASSHVLNPFVYGLTNTKIRSEIRNKLGCKTAEEEPLMRRNVPMSSQAR